MHARCALAPTCDCAAYSLEGGAGYPYTRHNFSAQIEDFDLRDTYWPAFAAVLRSSAKPKGVMCSYAAINGVPSCANAMLNAQLRGPAPSGFNASDVYITSDTGAIADVYNAGPDFPGYSYGSNGPNAACLAMRDGGVDMDSGIVYWNHLLNATRGTSSTPPGASEGVKHPCRLSMARIDQALTRVMRPRFELGLFDANTADQPYWNVPPDAVGTPETHALSLQMAREGIVLLRNPPQARAVAGSRASAAVLPLRPGQRVAVIGPHANATGDMIGNCECVGRPVSLAAPQLRVPD